MGLSIDREKVIKGLNSCSGSDPCVNSCPYYDNCGNNYSCTSNLAKDALALLKEQEAKILTVNQLEDALDTVVWLETPVSENLADGYSLIMAYSHKYGYMFFDSPFGDNPSQDRLEYSEYGKSWRCWNKRPTDEQRQAVKWE